MVDAMETLKMTTDTNKRLTAYDLDRADSL